MSYSFVGKTKNQVSVATVILGIALLSSTPVGLFTRSFNHIDVAYATPVTSEKLVELTNAARAENGLPTLVVSSLLTASAEGKSNDMLEKDYFAHTSPEGLSPWYWFQLVGYNYTFAGENLAKNYATAEAMFDAWMASPTHRANILSVNFHEVGIAIAADESVIYATSHFGARTGSAGGTTVTPTGTAGQSTAPKSTRQVTLDTTPPTIKTTGTSGTIMQGGKIGFELTVDGNPVKVTATIGSKVFDLVAKDGKWVGEMTLFAGGKYDVVVKAEDAVGNFTSEKIGEVTVELPELVKENPSTRTLVAAYWKDVAANEAAPISLALILMLVIGGVIATYEVGTRRLAGRLAKLVVLPRMVR